MLPTPQQSFADPKTLIPNPWNTNVVSPDNEAKIDESLRRFGMFKPIVVRTLPNGTLQILGGAHRRDSAIRLGMKSVPIINVGEVDDKHAKEIGLVDNGRYGDDDTLQLAALLEDLGTPEDLSKFMPYTDSDFASIFASVNIALDDLDLPEDDESTSPKLPAERQVQTHQIMRFKVPAGDVATITDAIEKTMKSQKFTDEDSLSNAGNALVHIFRGIEV
ncbi:ParB/RepB/Spo0J family partition protein [Undibacterium sp. 5I1]|uniref:ParB/RepB/Spo0J family partition protein n=1 Tax=unclassified Undibacterium TaxID=2630295 RepID=UPI002AB58DA2|nr:MULTISPECIES: ParB/RepB/Spo0J family partition protein [unclassified Undibacterium]MDY7537594.1 ParB/RepB/Spo0J family partition protein [Undibacterium sp. 5I1]MEB0230138.1 ParB/RepB/Spo0J family partition protein [Undibacterium sp. 10I3]MEB0256330.1 ParB/RepB/Spo0J family partition protein [Undibacterium sp. 5I1]